MKDTNLQLLKDMDGAYRLFAEMLLGTYNNILTNSEYINAVSKWLLNRNKYYGFKLQKHFESINWLMNDSIGSLCFKVLNLEHIKIEDVSDSIFKKIHNPKKFNKFFSQYSIKVNTNASTRINKKRDDNRTTNKSCKFASTSKQSC